MRKCGLQNSTMHRVGVVRGKEGKPKNGIPTMMCPVSAP
jgi:hypothetical protein